MAGTLSYTAVVFNSYFPLNTFAGILFYTAVVTNSYVPIAIFAGVLFYTAVVTDKYVPTDILAHVITNTAVLPYGDIPLNRKARGISNTAVLPYGYIPLNKRARGISNTATASNLSAIDAVTGISTMTLDSRCAILKVTSCPGLLPVHNGVYIQFEGATTSSGGRCIFNTGPTRSTLENANIRVNSLGIFIIFEGAFSTLSLYGGLELTKRGVEWFLGEACACSDFTWGRMSKKSGSRDGCNGCGGESEMHFLGVG